MIYLLFALLFFVLAMYWKHQEERWDYILLGLSVFLVFLQFVISWNEDFYREIGKVTIESCTFIANASISTSECHSRVVYDMNASFGQFSTQDLFVFKTIEYYLINLSSVLFFGILITGVLYNAWKGLYAFKFIKK